MHVWPAKTVAVVKTTSDAVKKKGTRDSSGSNRGAQNVQRCHLVDVGAGDVTSVRSRLTGLAATIFRILELRPAYYCCPTTLETHNLQVVTYRDGVL